MARSRGNHPPASRKSIRDVALLTSVNLSLEDQEFFRDCLELRLELAEDLLGQSLSTAFKRDILSLKEIDVQAYYSSFKSIKEQLLIVAPSYERVDWPAFKRQVGRTHPLKWVVATVRFFFPLTDASFRKLFQWVTFDEKVNFPSADYSDRLIEEYLSDEEELSSLEYPVGLTEQLAQIMKEWLRSYHPYMERFAPHHGSGAVAELERRLATPYAKTEKFCYDERIVGLFRDVLFNEDINEVLYHPSFLDNPLWRVCRVQFVPKTALTNRVISAEPVTLMWLQQGIVAGFEDWLNRHSSLTHYHPRTQVINQLLALLGSKNGSHATLDLSKASDSVTWQLVRLCFHDTNLWPCLEATRSDFAMLPDGSIIRLEKFAPMGSRFCFPIESLIFAAICELAIRRVTGHKSSIIDYSIVGDDIAIAAPFVDEVLFLLKEFHFKVNLTKSFWNPNGHYFRESCGTFALDGKELRLCRLARKLEPIARSNDTDVTPDQWSSWCSLSNQLYLLNLRRTRRLVQSWMRRSSWFTCTMRYSVRELAHAYHVHMPHLLTDGPVDREYHFDTTWDPGLYQSRAACVSISKLFDFDGWVYPVRRHTKLESADAPELDGGILLFLWLWEAESRRETGSAAGISDVEPETQSVWSTSVLRESTVLTVSHALYL